MASRFIPRPRTVIKGGTGGLGKHRPVGRPGDRWSVGLAARGSGSLADFLGNSPPTGGFAVGELVNSPGTPDLLAAAS